MICFGCVCNVTLHILPVSLSSPINVSLKLSIARLLLLEFCFLSQTKRVFVHSRIIIYVLQWQRTTMAHHAGLFTNIRTVWGVRFTNCTSICPSACCTVDYVYIYCSMCLYITIFTRSDLCFNVLRYTGLVLFYLHGWRYCCMIPRDCVVEFVWMKFYK